MKNKINQWACYNRIWSWSPMPCEKHGPRASVTTKTSAFGLGFCLLNPSGHVFHTAWETMIKSYNISQTYSDFTMLILGPTPINCLEWWPYQDPWPYNLVVVNQNLRFGSHYAVGPLITESQTIPARYVLRRNAFIATYAEQNVDTGTREILIVDPHCPHQWVTWNSTTRDDLPVGAVVGGHLENGVLLYVARAWLTVGLWVIGYYNPETEQAHFWFSKAIETTTMDILVML